MKTDSENDSVAEELDRSRRDVLDLTLRNPLLNFRPPKAKGLKIVGEIPREVYRILVEKERVMYFKAKQDISEELRLPMAEAEDNSDELAERHVDDRLQSPYEQASLDQRLKNTYRHARLSIEEQGVNILYLALGALNWYESDSTTPN